MKVYFLHVETYPPEEIGIHRALAARMLRSVKAHMACEVVQMTDWRTPIIPGVDGVQRLHPNGMGWIAYSLEHMGRHEGEVVFLDTDCVVQRDLRPVFEQEFDVALTFKKSRFATYVDDGGTKHLLPSNGGVMFSRCPRFWREKKTIVEGMTDPMSKAWWGGGIALNKIAERGGYEILWLDADVYNYTPNDPKEDTRLKSVVHYKGRRRKHWNLPGEWAELPEERELVVGA